MPDFRRTVLGRLAALHLDPVQESSLAEELAQHLEDRYREFLASGASPEDAHHRALAELDDHRPFEAALKPARPSPGYHPEPPSARRPANFLEDLARDVRYALRTFRQSPLFGVSVVLTLGFGIGANTSVFTLINTLLLNPLPLPDSSTLSGVSTANTNKNSGPAAPLPVSYPNLADLESQGHVFSSLAAYTSVRSITLQTGRNSERIFAGFVSGSYFSTFGLHPALGRFFVPEETRTPGAAGGGGVLTIGGVPSNTVTIAVR